MKKNSIWKFHYKFISVCRCYCDLFRWKTVTYLNIIQKDFDCFWQKEFKNQILFKMYI